MSEETNDKIKKLVDAYVDEYGSSNAYPSCEEVKYYVKKIRKDSGVSKASIETLEKDLRDMILKDLMLKGVAFIVFRWLIEDEPENYEMLDVIVSVLDKLRSMHFVVKTTKTGFMVSLY